MTETHAERFLNAFSKIEEKLAQQQDRRTRRDDWPSFAELLRDSSTLPMRHKELLRQYAKLRNAIAHGTYVGGQPIADPRQDVVLSIERIRDLLLRPPLLVKALSGHECPQVFELDDDVSDFLSLVVEKNYSQAPVRDGESYQLITTNELARYIAPSLIQDGIVETGTIREVLEFAETGDRLEILSESVTVLQAINFFSGEARTKIEPPSALLVLDAKNEHEPLLLCSRSDLSVLYAQLDA